MVERSFDTVDDRDIAFVSNAQIAVAKVIGINILSVFEEGDGPLYKTTSMPSLLNLLG